MRILRCLSALDSVLSHAMMTTQGLSNDQIHNWIATGERGTLEGQNGSQGGSLRVEDDDAIEKVDLAHDDPLNPRNWPEWKKWAIVIAIGN